MALVYRLLTSSRFFQGCLSRITFIWKVPGDHRKSTHFYRRMTISIAGTATLLRVYDGDFQNPRESTGCVEC